MKYNLSALACGLLLAVGLSLAATAQPIPDADSDGVPDSQDNCMLQQNAPQGDTDLDGYGNACDGDFDNDGIVFGTDFNLFMQHSNTSAPTYDEQYDLDCDDIVFGTDFNLFKQLFNGPPGPSGLPCAGTPPCPATAHPCPEAEICDDAIDNDADGDIDCADHSDCDGQPGGPGGELCAGAETGLCDDGFDNDADGDIDCVDADCAGAPACSAGNRLTVGRVASPVLGIGPDDGLWNATVATSYSMTWRDDINDTCPPDSNCSGQPPTLFVKAIHDGVDIAFRMEWDDISASSEVFEPKDFGDRAVIMLNANRICQMGSPTDPTNMWFWNAADKTQGAYGSVQNLIAGGLGTVTHTSGDDNIQVVSNHTDTQWQVVMSRPLSAVDPGDQFEFALGVTTEVAFALYDGAYKQRNGAKWISGRESIDIAP
jgi:DMSO reductase family type II enzyme heme b subunit